MVQSFLRLFLLVLVLAGLAILFFYAFVAALIITPVLFLLFYFFGRKSNIRWTVVRTGMSPGGFQQPPRPGHGPVIDHDPNDLPPPEDRRP